MLRNPLGYTQLVGFVVDNFQPGIMLVVVGFDLVRNLPVRQGRGDKQAKSGKELGVLTVLSWKNIPSSQYYFFFFASCCVQMSCENFVTRSLTS